MWKIYSNTYPIQIPNTLLKNIFCSGEYSWMCQVHNKPKHINLYNYIIFIIIIILIICGLKGNLPCAM